MQYRLLVLDIDNTVFDWVSYYVQAFEALIHAVHQVTGIDADVLFQESRAVFTAHRSIEHPFIIQNLPSVLQHYGMDFDRLLQEGVVAGRTAFNQVADKFLVPYSEVATTLLAVRQEFPHIPIVALTDAPRYVAMWKLNKLGVLSEFDAVYGLSDPVLPTSPTHERILVDVEILMKHVSKSSFDFAGKIRVLPEEYEKPGTRGLKTVLMDYNLDEDPQLRHQVLWVGDNLKKDVQLGRRLGVTTVWARYGTLFPDVYKQRLLRFSPQDKVEKNLALDPLAHDSPRPDFTIEHFAELLPILRQKQA